jgi:hypothetical protein
MQFEVQEDPDVIFIPIVGSLLTAQISLEDNDPAKVLATNAVTITMKAED